MWLFEFGSLIFSGKIIVFGEKKRHQSALAAPGTHWVTGRKTPACLLHVERQTQKKLQWSVLGCMKSDQSLDSGIVWGGEGGAITPVILFG